MRKIGMLFLICLLSACATQPPTPTELSKADYGFYPANYKALLEKNVKATLVDEGSAKFRYPVPPAKTWDEYSSGRQYGYGICFDVNAKNRMGGYVGYIPVYAFIRDGKVVYISLREQSDLDKAGWGQYLCQKFFANSASLK